MAPLMYHCEIVADSISEAGARITTMEVTYPRFVHGEFMTHRWFSRNSASSRAIPVKKTLDFVLSSPVEPVHYGANQRGMSAQNELSDGGRKQAQELWLQGAANAVETVRATQLLDDGVGLHKQIANRMLEPWLWHTVIVTATEWDNFYALRCHPDAQPEIHEIAMMMRKAAQESTPKLVKEGQYHLPLFHEDADAEGVAGVLADPAGTADRINEILIQMGSELKKHERAAFLTGVKHDPDIVKLMVSTARCARVSYLTHAGQRDLVQDLALYYRLVGSGHMSPCEHPARPMTGAELLLIRNVQDKAERLAKTILGTSAPRWLTEQMEFAGNFRGWVQHRKELPYEENFGARPE